MANSRLPAWLPWLGIAVLVLVLGGLQHQWLGEVIRSERERRLVGVHLAGRHAADDFDRELSRAFLHFQPPPETLEGPELETFYAELARSWSTSEVAGLVRRIYLVRTAAHGDSAIAALEIDRPRFDPVEWPDRLDGLRSWVEQPKPDHPPKPIDAAHPVPYPLLPDVPGLVIPLTGIRAVTHGPPDDSQEDQFRSHVAGFLSTMVVLEIDLRFVVDELLPELLARYRLGADSEYDVNLRVRPTNRLLFASAGSPIPADEVAARTPIFQLRPLAELRSMLVEVRARDLSLQESAGLNLAAIVTAVGGAESGWILEVAHREGALEAVVTRNQVRHLWIIGGVLAVLLLALGSIQLSSRRARSLARQQLEFVAGVSHELKTPLAAIRSLTQNLSRGVITEPEKVRTYGEMIEREQTRLSEMVDQVLAFSGALSGEAALHREPLDLGTVADEAIERTADQVAEAGKEIVLETPRRPVPVDADPSSLRRAVENLISNAVKYGGDARRIRISVSDDLGSGRGRIDVRDDGPGIPADEQSRLFDPFFRGASSRASQSPGSGLGLSLVRRVAEAHGGSATVVSTPGRGATFTIELPLGSGSEV